MGKRKDERMRKRSRSWFSVMPSRTEVMRGRVPYTVYDTALSEIAYGKPQQLGDLFGDIMGAVVGKDNWEARPEWMKRVQVKPNPAQLFNTASKVVPPRLVGNVVAQANRAGFDMFYRTPAGSIPVTPEFAEGVYGNYPTFLKTREVFESIPSWVYLLGGAGILLVFMTRKK